MSHPQTSTGSARASRREFLKQSGTTAVAAGAVAGSLSLARSVHAAGSDVLRVGLVGCGGRGTGAAVQALKADPNTHLVAMGDAFADSLESSLANLKKSPVADRVAVDPDHRFVGFDCYKHVVDSDVDVVLLAEPPHFRPLSFAYAVAKGKHTFVEKPVAVDAPGVLKVLATAEEARRKNLTVVSGLCWRYDFGARAAIEQVHAGRVGEIVALECAYNTPGRPKWPLKQRQSNWSDMEYQLRNWYYYTWLSGDHIVEQAIHSVDKCAWALRDQTPIACTSLGGLQCRTGDDVGNIFDHHAVSYEYPGGVKLYFYTRQQPGTTGDVSSHVLGSTGVCHVERPRIESRTGETLWRYDGPKNVMHQTEHDELFAALRAGQTINNGAYMATSTMLCVMGRMASYTGQRITWEAAMKSQEDLSPPKYDWTSLATPTVAMPGITPLV